MGSRAQRQVPKVLEKKAYEKADSSEKPAAKRKAGFGSADIIEATHDVEGLTYRPRS
jgi:pre-mRNA-splicing helicase BRR2